MKRAGVLISLSLLIIMFSTAFASAAPFGVEETSPKNGETGMSVDNMGVKVYFNEDIYSKDNQKANAKRCKLTDPKGKKVPVRTVFNPKEKNIMMVLADTEKGAKIKGSTKYKLTIDSGFVSTKGNIMEKPVTVSFKTLNPQSSMTVSMVMMGVMVVGMIFFTSREAKKQAQKDVRKKEEAVNPYKEAKRTGKSVEEVVAAEQKKKEKQAAKDEAKKKRHKEENKVEIASDNIRVSKPMPISLGGSTYKTGRAEAARIAEEKEKQKTSQKSKKKSKKKKH